MTSASQHGDRTAPRRKCRARHAVPCLFHLQPAHVRRPHEKAPTTSWRPAGGLQAYGGLPFRLGLAGLSEGRTEPRNGYSRPRPLRSPLVRRCLSISGGAQHVRLSCPDTVSGNVGLLAAGQRVRRGPRYSGDLGRDCRTVVGWQLEALWQRRTAVEHHLAGQLVAGSSARHGRPGASGAAAAGPGITSSSSAFALEEPRG